MIEAMNSLEVKKVTLSQLVVEKIHLERIFEKSLEIEFANNINEFEFDTPDTSDGYTTAPTRHIKGNCYKAESYHFVGSGNECCYTYLFETDSVLGKYAAIRATSLF